MKRRTSEGRDTVPNSFLCPSLVPCLLTSSAALCLLLNRSTFSDRHVIVTQKLRYERNLRTHFDQHYLFTVEETEAQRGGMS
jgi:zona occludens toxin (predicted ATPase)